MSKLTTSYLIQVFTELGSRLSQPDATLQQLVITEKNHNAWFTPESVQKAIHALTAQLTKGNLEQWLSAYQLTDHAPKKVGLILAGNIPLVGFHDVLCVLMSGNIALIKASSQDARLITYLLKLATDIEPEIAQRYQIVERLEGFDAIIATGSNNTSRYFEYYFGKVPNIIRKNRNSLAVLTGTDTREDLFQLGYDIFDYYGLGCRNVSKLFVPKGYDLTFFFESIQDHYPVSQHHKYHNNYDYNKSIYLVNRDKHFDNGFLLVKEDERMTSPLAVLFYEEYESIAELEQKLAEQSDQIQCIVTNADLQANNQVVSFGQSQCPALWEYADRIDTMRFLADL